MNQQLTQYAGAIAIMAMLAGLIHLIMIIATAPDPYEDPGDIAGGGICITDDAPEYIAFGTPYDELFPAGYVYGKDCPLNTASTILFSAKSDQAAIYIS